MHRRQAQTLTASKNGKNGPAGKTKKGDSVFDGLAVSGKPAIACHMGKYTWFVVQARLRRGKMQKQVGGASTVIGQVLAGE